MKFAHIADVHIGSWRDPKLKDLSTIAFKSAIDESIREKVDFVLIAGDLFNTALPGIDHLKTVIKKLNELKAQGIPLYFIAGSHDFSPSGKTMLDIIEEAGLGINVTRGKINDDKKLELAFTVDKKTGAKITGMIGKRGMLEKSYYDALDKRNLEAEKGFKIFMFHTALDEMKPEDLKEMPSSPASFLPKGFDYYAGGHVHIVKQKDLSEHGYKTLVYPGPVFPANFSELEKLGAGSYFIYDNGSLEKKEIVIKESLHKDISVDNKTPEESEKIIIERFQEEYIKDKIILMRVHGKLFSGKASDIDFKRIFTKLYDDGAYFVMKNTSKITSPEFEEVSVAHSTTDELEERLIRENSGKIAHGFSDEIEMTKSLLNAFSSEKHEGEKVNEYDARVRKEIDQLLEKR